MTAITRRNKPIQKHCTLNNRFSCLTTVQSSFFSLQILHGRLSFDGSEEPDIVRGFFKKIKKTKSATFREEIFCHLVISTTECLSYPGDMDPLHSNQRTSVVHRSQNSCCCSANTLVWSLFHQPATRSINVMVSIIINLLAHLKSWTHSRGPPLRTVFSLHPTLLIWI